MKSSQAAVRWGQRQTRIPEPTVTLLIDALAETEEGRIWRLFFARYWTAIVRFAMKYGLSQETAEELAQDSLLEFYRACRAGSYERSRGRLRGFMWFIARKRIGNAIKRKIQDREKLEALLTHLRYEQEHTEDTISVLWGREWNRVTLHQAFRSLRQRVNRRSYQSACLSWLKEWPASRVAAHLGITAKRVHENKSTAKEFLTRILDVLDKEDRTLVAA